MYKCFIKLNNNVNGSKFDISVHYLKHLLKNEEMLFEGDINKQIFCYTL